jgi:hypothetical protein
MTLPSRPLRRLTLFPVFALLALTCAARLAAQAMPTADAPPAPSTAPTTPDDAQAQMPPPPPLPPGPAYDKALFQNPIPAQYLTFLGTYAGAPSGNLYHDKTFHHILHDTLPDCLFHYGRDMPLDGALDMVMSGSTAPVQVRENRYVLVAGQRGPYLRGMGFIWVDMQDGIVLGGFYFHPTNGEPTPTVAVFSKQVKTKDKGIAMSQLPPEFERDLEQWAQQWGVPVLTTRYFLTGTNLRILLEHTEDYCYVAGNDPNVPMPPPEGCEQMNADAADVDVNAAYYLEQVNYATNATAWMITGQDQVDWLAMRESTCRVGPHPLECRIRMTRQRTQVIVTRTPIRHIAGG